MPSFLPMKPLSGEFKTIMDKATDGVFQILGHPNLKAFISHAGLNSLSEATYHGVPVILLPLFTDQDYNGYRIEATEIGIRLEMQNLNSKVLIRSLYEILNNPKYASNMKSMSAIFRDRPMNPIETAVYWTEFVLRHNDTKILKPIQNLTFFQRRFYDVALVLILLISLVLALLFCTGFRLVQRKLNNKSLIREFEPETKPKLQ
ncbi:unnamed protein product [Allacma fusca]|uniref:Glucuronosyltransferase n=1 Tax=Allacma fusca TaxID=39272 RepID=A0A8J2JW99_9HEXA|nr:unnamed protein product [Allacma fusca]